MRKKRPITQLMSQQPDTDIIYLYAKDPYEAKYQFLYNKRKSTGF